MKVNLFLDVYQGWKPQYACAVSNPCKKSEGMRRLMITVDVPDHFIVGHIDGALPVIESVEVDKGD